MGLPTTFPPSFLPSFFACLGKERKGWIGKERKGKGKERERKEERGGRKGRAHKGRRTHARGRLPGYIYFRRDAHLIKTTTMMRVVNRRWRAAC